MVNKYTSLGGGFDTSTPKRLRTLDNDSIFKLCRLDVSCKDTSPVLKSRTYTQTFT